MSKPTPQSRDEAIAARIAAVEEANAEPPPEESADEIVARRLAGGKRKPRPKAPDQMTVQEMADHLRQHRN